MDDAVAAAQFRIAPMHRTAFITEAELMIVDHEGAINLGYTASEVQSIRQILTNRGFTVTV